MAATAGRKDPFTAMFLSLFFPGAGHAYAGSPGKFVGTAVVVFGLLCASDGEGVLLLAAIAVHVFMAVAAAGAARRWNEAHAAMLDIPPPPPPTPVTSARVMPPGPPAHADADLPPPSPAWSGDVPPPPPPPPPPLTPSVPAAAGPPLTADDFLADLREAWQAKQAGALDEAAFAARKAAAIERVRVTDWDDGVALLEATSTLVGAGVLTPAERTRLKLRVSR